MRRDVAWLARLVLLQVVAGSGCSSSAADGEDTLDRCADNIDNDHDGLVDCADPRCQVFPRCSDDDDAGAHDGGDGDADSDGDSDSDSDGDGDAGAECEVPGDCPETGELCIVATCTDGVCGITARDCGDGVDCTDDSCSEDGCINTPSSTNCPDPPETFCDPDDGCVEPPECFDDGDCPEVDSFCAPATCVLGSCAQGPSPCSAEDEATCTVVGCDENSDQCFESPVHALCEDGDACTMDACDPEDPGADDGGCVNDPIDCADGVDCTTDTCDSLSGCTNTPVDAACADAVDCTTDTCDLLSGCANTPVDAVCADAVDCTTDTCDSLSGCANRPVDAACDDANPNTADVCDPLLGCSSTLTCDLLCRGASPRDCGPVQCGRYMDPGPCLAECIWWDDELLECVDEVSRSNVCDDFKGVCDLVDADPPANPASCLGPLEALEAYIKASNTGAGDLFGTRIALSADGATLAVAAPEEDSAATGVGGDQDSNAAERSGAVYVFRLTDGAWTQTTYVKASNGEAHDRFGNSIALSADGSVLAVGAEWEDSAATGVGNDEDSNGAPQSGAAYVFRRTDAVWAQEAYVKASNTGAGDGFGSSVALSADGSTLAVVAPQEASAANGIDLNQGDNSAQASGAAYVFRRTGGEWAQEAYVKASNTDAWDFFGTSIALSADGSVLAVGAYLEDSVATGVGGDQGSDDATNSGAAYVFRRTGILWAQEAYVKASNTDAWDNFGSSVALSADGGLLAVGARREASAAAGVGGDQEDDGAEGSGAVYLFRRADGAWEQEAYAKASNTGEDDELGSAIALSADGVVLAVSTGLEDSAATGIGGDQQSDAASDSGATYVFRRTDGAWRQEVYVKASNTGEGDELGIAIALSSDGGVLAVGAPQEDSAAAGVGGDQESNAAESSGAAYVYR